MAALVAGALSLSACSAQPSPTASESAAPGAAEPSSTPEPLPTLVADGSATENLPLFASIASSVWATERRAEGRAYVDALAAAGFPKADMEVTHDRTTVDNPADAIQFSVRWGGECLVGQVGPSTSAPTAVVLPEVPGGTCLIGSTRPIDW